MYNVTIPDIIAPLRAQTHLGAIMEPKPSSRRLVSYFQTLFTPITSDRGLTILLALIAQEPTHDAIAEATIQVDHF